MGISDHLTCLLRNLYAGQEATVRTGHVTTNWFQIGKEYVKAVYCHPTYLTYIQVSQEAGQVVWYSHLFQNFQQFVVIYTVKGFGVITKTEVYVFLEFSCFFYDPTDVVNLISGSSAFSKSSLNIWKLMVHILSPHLKKGNSILVLLK